MNIGILGSGMVGQALGKKFIDLGHSVTIGTRSPEKLADWARDTGGTVGSFTEAAAFGELIVLATHWSGGATENAIALADPANFAGKTVIDVNNPLDFSTGAPRLASVTEGSAGEWTQAHLPEAHVVKAFNFIGSALMVNPDPEADHFIAGNNDGAKQQVTQILHDFGWSGVVDLGGIESSRYLEALAMIWIVYWAKTQKSGHSFKLLGK